MTQEPLPGDSPEIPGGILYPPESRLVGPQTLALAKPVLHGAEPLPDLNLRALSGRHVRALSSEWGQHSALFLAAGLMTGLPDGVLDQLEGPDVGGLLKLVERMLWPVFDLPSSWVRLEDDRRLEDYPSLPSPLELVLERAIRTKTDEVSRLTFRPMTGRLARACPTTLELKRLPWLVCELTGAPRAVFDELEGLDLNRALVVAQCFFAASPSRPGRR